MDEKSQGGTQDDSAESSKPRGRAGWLISVSVAAGVLLLVVYGMLGQPPLDVGPAPDFTLSLFEEGAVSLSDLRGQVVVVNFWASWCPPCRDEAPDLQRIWQKYKGSGVAFVGVGYKDVRSKALAFIDEFEITFPNGPDPYSRISNAYGVRKVPETFVIGKDGSIAKHYIGPVTEDQLDTIIAELMED